MKPRDLFTLCLLLLTASGAAAQERAVRGRIANPDGEAVPYCTVSLRRAADSTILAGVISDSLGRYRLAPLTGDGCFLEFAHLAYETTTRPLAPQTGETVCDVVLTPSTNRIDEVTVLARFVERKAGRYTVSMAGNPLARERFLNEVLELLPGIRVNEQSTVTVNGRAVQTIYIDDREASLEELRALPAGSAETIEVQSNGSADQDASERGAVLRIRLRKLDDGGYRGSVQVHLGMRTGSYCNSGIAAPISARRGKFNFYNYLRYSHFSELHEYTKQAEYTDPAQTILTDEVQRTRHHTLSELLNVVYEATPRHRIGAVGYFSYASSVPTINAQNNTFTPEASTAARQSSYRSRGELDSYIGQAAATYRWLFDDEGSKLTADLDYVISRSDKDYLYQSFTEDAAEERTTERMRPRTDLLEADVKLSKHFSDRFTFGAGAEYYARSLERNTRSGAEGALQPEERFRYKGQGMATYVDGEFSLGDVEFSAGLRLQWDRVDHFTEGDTGWRRREYWRLCPNVAASWAIDAQRGTSLDLSYSRDDGYIPYDRLSPLRVREDEFHYSVGNPALRPAKGHEIDAVLTLNNDWSFSYNCSLANDIGQSVTRIDPDDPRVTYTIPVNCGSFTLHIFDLAYTGRLTPWWQVNWDLHGAISHRKYFDQSFDSKSMSIYLYNSIRFMKGFGMTFNMHAGTSVKHIEYWHNAVFSCSGSIYKYLFRDRLYLNFSCTNIVATDNKVRTWNMERSFLQNRRHRGRTWYSFSATFLFNNYKGNKEISRTNTLQNMSNEYK